MELVYLWVRQYKNIVGEGFNFSSRFRCKFHPVYDDIEHNGKIFKKTRDNCILEIIDKEVTKEPYPKHFFGDKINLTAIVGENGAGKSSLLEILTNKYSPVDFQNIFFLFYDKSNNKLTLHGAKYGFYNFINETELTNKSLFEINLVENFEELNSTKTVYLSNILNENDLTLPSLFVNRNYSHTVNISTTQILNQMKLIETKYGGIGSESRTGFDKIFRSYRIQEIQRAIILIKDEAIKIPFKLPTSIQIKNIDFKSFIENKKNSFDDANYRKILDVINKNNDQVTIFKNYLSTNLIIALLLENAKSNSFNPFLDELLQIVLDQKMTSDLQGFYANVKYKLLGHQYNINNSFFPVSDIDKFFSLADKILESLDQLQISNENGFLLELNIVDANFDFLEIYEKLIQQSEYFWDISWDGISSGEETFLYQFSRLYFLKKGFKESSYLNLKIDGVEAENIILLIDEGETTLHPNWQKAYVDYLIQFLKDNFQQNVHLILTSHSPFILSDIPKENVIFLEKGKQVDPKIDTFGANIHTLLAHGFFMDKGLMGKFAEKRLSKILKYLIKDLPTIDLTQEEIKFTIDAVGEELLQNKLENLYNEFYQIETKEDKYLKRISELEALLKEKNNA
jgi:energy-coupling factor transporter ATP-binding protein EcfA2